MTEKRFTTDNGSNEDVCLVDNITGKEYESNFDDIVDLLNDLNDGNEKLKSENEDLKIDISVLYRHYDKYEKICTKLKRENEQLKQSVNNLKDTIIKITIAYQRKYDRTIVDLVDEVHEEDITGLIKELKE